MLKQLLHVIIDKGNKSDMAELGDIFLDMVYDLKNKNKEWYECVKYKMYTMAYDDHLTKDLAHKWVSCMKNKDGSTGGHWTYEQTESVRTQYAPELHACDFYAILNMVYSDYYNSKFDTNIYVELAKDWLTDKDIPNGKALRYYFFVVK